jgi:glycosyltransferase involved in cell wall biosynthesis
MRKVLIIDNSLDLTGAFKAILSNACDLKNEFEFHFLIPSQSKNKSRIKDFGFKCLQLNIIEISKRPKDLLLYIPQLIINSWKVKRYVKKEGISIIHVNDMYNMVGLTSKIWKKTFVISHVRRMPESFPSMIYKFWVLLHRRFADKIIPVSRANAAIFGSSGKVEVIYDKLPANESLPSYSAIERDIVRILYLANYNRGKGQEYAIKIAHNLVKNNITNFEMNFYGGDFGMQKNRDFKSSLIKEAKEIALSDKVIFYDKTEHAERVMKDHDLVLNLSDSESFSNVSLEALYYGVPLIATNVGGTSEMFDDKTSGLLIERGNVEEMYQVLKELINSFPLRNQLSIESKKIVRNRFGIENTSFKLRDIYNGF